MDNGAFFSAVRAKLGPLSNSQVAGINTILTACGDAPLAHTAYMLGTAFHETNKTMQPVREAYWLSEDWRRQHLRYYPWYGRGYVQLTWQNNYEKADIKLGLNGELLRTPDLAMRPDIAAQVMRVGMRDGWFTGVKLSSILPSKGVATHDQYVNARTIINGRDRAELVEDYAQAFESALVKAGWSA